MSTMQALLKANDNMIESTARVQKKQKVQSEGSPYFETIAMRLLEVQKDLRKNYDDSGLAAIEIEIRIGMIVDNYRRWKGRSTSKSVVVVDPRINPNLRFRAGIDQIFARGLKSKLNLPTIKCSPQPLQIMRCDQTDNRWTVNSKGELVAAEKKQALDQTNLALIAHEYDIRINVATEIAAPITDSVDANVASLYSPVNRQQWVVERRKKRTSYSLKDPSRNKWRMDYTEVDILTKAAEATNASGKVKKEIELEFELEHAPMMDWLKERDYKTAVEKTRVLAEELVHLLDYCLPFETETEKESSLLVVNDHYYDFEINKLDALITNTDPVQPGRKKSDFLGSMPVNLTRQNLQEVQKTDYFITEKSDGIRYLLYVVPPPRATDASDAIAILVDRSRTIFKFRGCESVGKALGLGTVLDGELVFNRSLKENVFLVFDTLLYRRQSRIDLLFGERLEIIRGEILANYARNLPHVLAKEAAQNAASAVMNLPSKPLQMVRKAFVTRRELRVLLAKMRLEEGERVFYDPPEHHGQPSPRHHKSDGFIFQPNARYVSSRNYDLMKWKWAELRSVDLQISIPMEGTSNAAGGDWPIYLMCGGPDGTSINCTKRGDTNVGLGEFDAYRLLADMESPELANRGFSPVVEVAYDIQVGMWAYLQLRKDKDKPNFIDSVMGVFMEQAESISIEELEYSLTAASHGLESDYEPQIQKMKSKLLDWQRSEVARKTASAPASSQRK